jgi:hypothetical protein
MTEIFSGNISDNSVVNHIFIINHYFWQNYGFPTFSYNGYKEFANSDLGKKVIRLYTGNDATPNSNIFTTFSGTTGYYRKWNGEDYVLQSITPEQAVELLNYHESGKAGTSTADTTKDKQISEINTSVEGAIFFYNPALTSNTTTEAPLFPPDNNYTPPTTTPIPTPVGLPGNDKLILKLFFYTSGKSQKRTGRTITQKGMPLITDIPRTQAGSQFSHKNSAEQQRREMDSMPAVGLHVGPTPNEDNPKDAVTAPLRVSYDKQTGTWDASNQLLARLLSDIDPAMITGLGINSTNDFLNSKPKDFYKKDSKKYMGQRKTGYAMPLSMQNNNPEMYGPNLFKCGGEIDVEKILVVNRSNNSFKAGDIVLCSYIGGEWIVQKFGDTEASTDFSVGRWGFYKFVANSDWFFRGKDLSISWSSINDSNKIYGGPTILPSRCQTILRNKFYFGNALNVIQATMYQDQAVKLYSYLQTTSFDHTSAAFGGCASDKLYKRINQYVPAVSNGDTMYFSEVPIFWGPVFVDGYSTDGYSKIYVSDGNINVSKINESGNVVNITEPATQQYFTSDTPAMTGIIPAYTGSVGSLLADSNFSQLPADIATNGRYSDSSFPIEDTLDTIIFLNNANLTAIAPSLNAVVYSGLHTRFLTSSTNKTDVYALKPINPLKLQFTPLSAELAGSDDVNSVNAINMDHKLKPMSKALVQSIGVTLTDGTSLWGSYFGVRNILYTNVRNDTLGLGSTYLPPIVTHTGIPYDAYISYEPANKPLATLEAYGNYGSDTVGRAGSNLVGIIAARNAFTKSGGGVLTIEADQRFGMYGDFSTGGPSTVTGGIIGNIVSTLGIDSPTIKSQFLPVWGSTINDAINSFGTTALHAMVWDYWPEELTLFIPQYFSIMHFNPGIINSTPKTKTTKVTLGTTSYDILVDQLDYSIDFIVPTASGLTSVTGGHKHTSLAVGSIINSGTNIMAPSSRWNVSTIRRGQLVTDPGFYYYKPVVGLSDTGDIIEAGAGFASGDKIKIADDLVIVSDSNGTLTGFHFDEVLVEDLNVTIGGSIPKTKLKGSGFANAQFPASGYILTVPSPGDSARPAKIKFLSGIVYNQIQRDLGPKQRCPITKLSSSSADGTKRIEGSKTTVLSIENNSKAKYPGKYEAFYFFHNDIGHTYQTGPIGTDPSFSQRITINIS